MKKICFILTTELTVKAFLFNHLSALSQMYDVTVATNTNNPNFLTEIGINVKVISLPITRDINLFSDFGILIRLIKIIYREHFYSVHSVTPKAGLLAMLAASVLQVPLRVHTFTGQVWATKTGLSRFFLKWIDCLIAFLATDIIIDSPSQHQFLLDEKVIDSVKSRVFFKGSISGVDIAKFKPDVHAKVKIRRQLNIPSNSIIFLFVGRLTYDKGVLDLARAFSQLNVSNVHLLFVGPDEESTRAAIVNITGIRSTYVHFVGHVKTPESYMAASDVLCLPSYREGFGSVVIEAAAVGIPTIASRIYGLTDAVIDGETGLLHAPRDIEAIKICMEQMMVNKARRLKVGEQAQVRAAKEFDSKLITQAWVDFYRENVN